MGSVAKGDPAVDDHDDTAVRVQVYQLYHVLNHVALFGAGYVGQAMALVRAIVR